MNIVVAVVVVIVVVVFIVFVVAVVAAVVAAIVVVVVVFGAVLFCCCCRYCYCCYCCFCYRYCLYNFVVVDDIVVVVTVVIFVLSACCCCFQFLADFLVDFHRVEGHFVQDPLSSFPMNTASTWKGISGHRDFKDRSKMPCLTEANIGISKFRKFLTVCGDLMSF